MSFSVASALPPPMIVSDKTEFILQPNSVFNVSCTGPRNVVWTEPLLHNSFVFPGYYTATLFIYNATVENTGYYTCTYENGEDEADGELEEENETGIYVFVPGKQAVIPPSWRCGLALHRNPEDLGGRKTRESAL